MQRTALAIVLVITAAAYAIAETATMPTKPQVPIPLGTPPANAPLALPPPSDPDPAMNNPDMVSWQLFVTVNAPAATSGNNNALFETWASDDDTFTQNPVWPTTPTGSKLKPPALQRFAPAVHGLQPRISPDGSEEVRRNKVSFDFIKDNKLFTKAGLKAAFAAKKTITFPVDSIEVKANWTEVKGSIDPKKYHVNTAANGKQYALVSMHIISKQIPNWTWATFEHQDNKGRCDFIGCHDAFGAIVADVPAKPPVGTYGACAKTDALKKMMADAKLEAVFENYCLKGSQPEFTSATGVPTLLGNSVTENGFVNTSSCITCHSRASTDATGGSPQGAGFLNPPVAAVCPTGNPCSPNGTPNPTWFWNNPGKPNQTIKTLQTDFVWAIPLNAIGP